MTHPREHMLKVARFCGVEDQPWLDMASIDIQRVRVKSQRSGINDAMCAEMRKAFALQRNE